MKAGTTLPLALLDGHPDLLVLPSELNYFRHSDHPSLFPERKLARESDLPRLARSLLDDLYFLKLLNPERLARLRSQFELRPHDLHDFSAIDPAAFEEHVEGVDPGGSHPQLFLRFFQALLMATGREPDALAGLHAVEKSPLQEEHAPLLSSWFPEARFLHVVRNPYATLCALRIVGSRALVRGARNRYPYIRRLCASIGASVRLGLWARSFLPNYMMLRYEDLVLEPEKTMRRVCDLIGIPFHDCLRSPTLAGAPWGGNSMRGDAFAGIETAAVERWREIVTPFEIALVNRKLGGVLSAFGYAREEPRPAWRAWLPRSRERPLAWAANRVLLAEPGEL